MGSTKRNRRLVRLLNIADPAEIGSEIYDRQRLAEGKGVVP